MKKKLIAPIIITVIMILYFAFIIIGFVGAFFEGMSLIGFLLALIIPGGAAILMIYVCVQRVKEIEGGEEDEASKY